MKNIILATASLLLLLGWALPQPATSAENDLTKLITLLNNKTAKIKAVEVQENKAKSITFRDEEVNSYVFSLDKKVLKIVFKEEIRSFENGQYVDLHRTIGEITMDGDKIDRQKIGVNNGLIAIICQGVKSCMNREDRFINAIEKDPKAKGIVSKSSPRRFHIRGADQSLARQISNDLQALFAALAPPPEPVKEVTPTTAGENAEKK